MVTMYYFFVSLYLTCVMVQFSVGVANDSCNMDVLNDYISPEDLSMLYDMEKARLKNVTLEINPGLHFNSSASARQLGFKPNIKTVMIVHGFLSYGRALWVKKMAEAYLAKEDVNVLAVDWSAGSRSINYLNAVANTRTVGQDIYKFLKDLKNTLNVSFKKVHLIGHSLGAHICAFASKKIGVIYRITALDPAMPCFKTDNPRERLHMSDADFVDVIHTNGEGFGIYNATGHADFYPNGGMKQPGCEEENSIFGKCINKMVQAVLNAEICSHSRSQELFTESLTNGNCVFQSYSWDLTKDGIVKGIQSKSTSVMGIHAEGDKAYKRALGTFFVVTNDEAPYCGNYTEDHLIKSLKVSKDKTGKMPQSQKEIPKGFWQFFSNWMG